MRATPDTRPDVSPLPFTSSLPLFSLGEEVKKEEQTAKKKLGSVSGGFLKGKTESCKGLLEMQ